MDTATPAVAIADSIPDTCSDAFAVTHGDTITDTFSDTFGDTFGDTFTDTHKSAMQLLISSPFPEVSEISDTFAVTVTVTFSPPLQPHFNAMIYHAQDGEHWWSEQRYNRRDRKIYC